MSVLVQFFSGLSQLIQLAMGMQAWTLASIVNARDILSSQTYVTVVIED